MTTLLPPEFLARVRSLEDAYMASDDPIAQSGFHAGAVRWRAKREPILKAVEGGGSFLDIGCANGYLWSASCGELKTAESSSSRSG